MYFLLLSIGFGLSTKPNYRSNSKLINLSRCFSSPFPTLSFSLSSSVQKMQRFYLLQYFDWRDSTNKKKFNFNSILCLHISIEHVDTRFEINCNFLSVSRSLARSIDRSVFQYQAIYISWNDSQNHTLKAICFNFTYLPGLSVSSIKTIFDWLPINCCVSWIFISIK